jgi:uncharacterized protein (DUF2249 family)/mannose-6-phosphate isomerase-like protein (cupin superfamily)
MRSFKMSGLIGEPIIIDVRSIPKPQRHPLIFEAMDTLAVGQGVLVVNDHNPIPLRGQVEDIYGGQFEWQYLEEGPEIFRLQFTRRALAPEGWQRSSSHTTGQLLPVLEAPSVVEASSLDNFQVQTSMLGTSSNAAPPLWVDLLERSGAAARTASPHSGPQWAHECEDLDLTLLSWEKGKRIESHVNNEVDGVLIGIEGTGVVTVNGEAHEMRANVMLLIPKGCEHSIESTSERFSYLSMHRRRRGLMPTLGGRSLG